MTTKCMSPRRRRRCSYRKQKIYVCVHKKDPKRVLGRVHYIYHRILQQSSTSLHCHPLKNKPHAFVPPRDLHQACDEISKIYLIELHIFANFLLYIYTLLIHSFVIMQINIQQEEKNRYIDTYADVRNNKYVYRTCVRLRRRAASHTFSRAYKL